MKRRRRIMTLILVIALVGFIGCAAQDNLEEPTVNDTTTASQTTTKTVTTKAITTTAQKTTVTEKETTGTEQPFKEKMEISWLAGDCTTYEEGRWDEVELEEMFHVDIKPWNILVNSGNMDQVYMMLASGDVPDYGFYYTGGKYLLEQGLGRTVPLSLIRQHYTGYYNKMMEDPTGYYMNKVEESEQEYYGLTALTPRATHTGHVPLWRLDWLESIGIKMENLTPMSSVVRSEWSGAVSFSNTKFSVDEVKDILRAFTEDDPDGNGIDDTYGAVYANTVYDCYISYAMFGFDKDPSHFYNDPVTGDVVPYFAYSRYKEMMQYVSEMLDKGYMQYVEQKEVQKVWSTGKTGYINALSGYRILGTMADMEQWPPAIILLQDPNAKFVITPVPGENGKYRPYATFNWDPNVTYPIGINVSDDKLVRLFQMLDYAYFGDNWIRYKWGLENIHYTWSAEPFGSPLIKTDPEKIPNKYSGKGTKVFGQFGNLHFINDYKTYMNYDACTVQFVEFWNKHNPGGFYDDSLWIRPYKYFSIFTMPVDSYNAFKKIREETIDQINAVHNDFYKRFMAGQIANYDSEWEQYIEQIYAAGIKQWVSIWNKDDVLTFEAYRSQK